MLVFDSAVIVAFASSITSIGRGCHVALTWMTTFDNAINIAAGSPFPDTSAMTIPKGPALPGISAPGIMS